MQISSPDLYLEVQNIHVSAWCLCQQQGPPDDDDAGQALKSCESLIKSQQGHLAVLLRPSFWLPQRKYFEGNSHFTACTCHETSCSSQAHLPIKGALAADLVDVWSDGLR